MTLPLSVESPDRVWPAKPRMLRALNQPTFACADSMKRKYPERLNALLDSASTPQRRAAIERTIAYTEYTHDQFIERPR